MEKAKFKKLLQDYEDGSDNALDRKTTTFSMRMSPSLKAFLTHQAGKLGVSISEYMEIIIGEIERDRTAQKRLVEAVGSCEKLDKENEQLKERVAKLEETEAKYNFIRQRYNSLFEKAKTRKYPAFKGQKIDSFEDFMGALSNCVKP